MTVQIISLIVSSFAVVIVALVGAITQYRISNLQAKLNITKELNKDQRDLYDNFCRMYDDAEKGRGINLNQMKNFIKNAIVFASDETIKLLEKMVLSGQEPEKYTQQEIVSIGMDLLLSFRKGLRFTSTKLGREDLIRLKIKDWPEHFNIPPA